MSEDKNPAKQDQTEAAAEQQDSTAAAAREQTDAATDTAAGDSSTTDDAEHHRAAGHAPQRRTGLLAVILALLLLMLLGGLGGAGWWGWQQWESFQTELAASQADWEQERADLSARVGDLESTVSARDGALDSLSSDIATTRDDLIALAEQVSRESGLQEQDVQRLEVEYLLRTARHMSYLTGDLQQAENLLLQADRMIREFDDLAYLPVREALAEDIQALRAVPVPDVDGLYFQLAALAGEAGRWEWWPEDRFATDEQDTLPDDASWHLRLGHELRDLINIRYRDDVSSRRLTATEFAQARTQFRLLMQQAQAALLQGRQSLYESSLEQAMDWVAEGGDQIPQGGRILAQLQELRGIQVQVQVPDIDRGLTRLQALHQAREDDVGEDEQ